MTDQQLREAIERKRKRAMGHDRRSAASRKAAGTRWHRMKSPKWDWTRPVDPPRYDPQTGRISDAPKMK